MVGLSNGWVNQWWYCVHFGEFCQRGGGPPMFHREKDEQVIDRYVTPVAAIHTRRGIG